MSTGKHGQTKLYPSLLGTWPRSPFCPQPCARAPATLLYSNPLTTATPHPFILRSATAITSLPNPRSFHLQKVSDIIVNKANIITSKTLLRYIHSLKGLHQFEVAFVLMQYGTKQKYIVSYSPVKSK